VNELPEDLDSTLSTADQERLVKACNLVVRDAARAVSRAIQAVNDLLVERGLIRRGGTGLIDSRGRLATLMRSIEQFVGSQDDGCDGERLRGQTAQMSLAREAVSWLLGSSTFTHGTIAQRTLPGIGTLCNCRHCRGGMQAFATGASDHLTGADGGLSLPAMTDQFVAALRPQGFVPSGEVHPAEPQAASGPRIGELRFSRANMTSVAIPENTLLRATIEAEARTTTETRTTVRPRVGTRSTRLIRT